MVFSVTTRWAAIAAVGSPCNNNRATSDSEGVSPQVLNRSSINRDSPIKDCVAWPRQWSTWSCMCVTIVWVWRSLCLRAKNCRKNTMVNPPNPIAIMPSITQWVHGDPAWISRQMSTDIPKQNTVIIPTKTPTSRRDKPNSIIQSRPTGPNATWQQFYMSNQPALMGRVSQ